jgi:hypothetical protein
MACLGLILASAAHAVHYTATLTGAQEVPPNGSTATGTCSLDQIANYLIGSCEHTVASPLAAHIHMAPPGVAGGIVFPFPSPVSPINVNWVNMTAGDLTALAAGNLYVNIHTGAFPDGEIRGQIVLDEEEPPPPPPGCTDDADTACLQDGRFKVEVTWETAQPASGTGKVMSFGGMRAQNNESVFLWFFSTTNLEIGLKILNACGLNDRYWVFISGLTDVGWHVTITDTETGLVVKEYENTLGSLTQTTADTDAIPCD